MSLNLILFSNYNCFFLCDKQIIFLSFKYFKTDSLLHCKANSTEMKLVLYIHGKIKIIFNVAHKHIYRTDKT